jgi:hypothetical protein
MPPLFQCRRQLEDQPVSETRLTQIPRPRARRDRSRHRRRPAAALPPSTTSAACSSRTRSCTACRRTSPSWPPGTATSTSPWLQSRLPRGSHQRGGEVDHGIIEGSCRGPAGGTRGGVRRGTGPGWDTRESAYAVAADGARESVAGGRGLDAGGLSLDAAERFPAARRAGGYVLVWPLG